MAYYFSYRNEYGRRKRYRIGNSDTLSPAQARDRAIQLSARVVAGEDVQEKKKQRAPSSEARHVANPGGLPDPQL